MSRDELKKCLEGLNVDEPTTERFVESLMDVHRQLVRNNVRSSHPALLKFKHAVEDILKVFNGGHEPILTAQQTTQTYHDTIEALDIQIQRTQQLLKKD